MPRFESRSRSYVERTEIFETETPPGRYAQSDRYTPIAGDDYYGPYEVEESSFDAQGNWKCTHIYSDFQTKSWHTIFKDGGHYFQFPDGTQGYYHPQRPGSEWLRDHKSAPKTSWNFPYSPCATEFNRPPLQWLIENHIRLPESQDYGPPNDIEPPYERWESSEASFENQSQYHESEYMDSYPGDPDISYDEAEPDINMRSLDWRSPSRTIRANTASSEWRREAYCFGALEPADPIPRQAVAPRPKQTARKPSGRKATPKAQTARKQTARKSQSTVKSTKATTTATTKPKPKPKATAKAKTPGPQKKAPTKRKTAQAKKGPSAQENTILEFNGQTYQCRLEFRAGAP